MRTYIQKPRTVKGWTGPANQPDPLAPPDIEQGMNYSRKLMVEITEKNLAIADEALFTHNARGYIDLLSWVAIGARSSEDQEHRIFASSIDAPVGIKNPTSGSVQIGVNGVVAAQHSHVAVFDGYEVETAGNQFAHLVLRGGNDEPNYSLADLEYAHTKLLQSEVANPSLIIDVSHGNCRINGVKDYQQQGTIIFEILKSITDKPPLKKLVKGFMLESFLKGGRQEVSPDKPIDMNGLSITDSCLSFEDTQQLIIELAETL
jgi:3-deoxy-7-phosphoheptulonate synthase